MTTRGTPGAPPVYRWVILAAVTLAFMGSYGFAFAVIGPLVPELSSAFGIGLTEAGLISTLMFAGAAVMSIPAGLLVDRWGVRRTVALAQGVLVVGWVGAYFSPSFPAVLAARAVVGLGGITMGVVGAAALVQWFQPRALGLPMGVWAAGLPIGIAWGTPLAGAIIASAGWRAAFLAGSVIAVLCLVLVLATVRPGPIRPPPAPAGAGVSPRRVFTSPEVWKFNLALFFAFVPFMAVTTYWVTWLSAVKSISSLSTASNITGLIGIAGIVGAVAAGAIAMKIKRSKPVFVAACAVFALGLLAFLGVTGILGIVVVSLVVGLASYMLATMMFDIPPLLVEPQFTGTALGIAVTFFNIAGIVGPIVLGAAFSSTGALLWPCTIMVVSLVVAALLAQSMRIR